MTIFQRLNTSLALMMALLLSAVGLVFWVQDGRMEALLRRERLSAMHFRLCYDLLVMTDALRALSVDPKNETEGLRRAEAEKDLREQLRTAREENRDYPELTSAIKNLDDFVFGAAPGSFGLLQSKVLQVADTDLANALSMLNSNYREVSRQRDLHFRDLAQQVAGAGKALSLGAQRDSALGWTGVLIAVLASALVWRWHSRAITEPLKRLTSSVAQMREGDLTQRAPADQANEFGTVGRGLNRLADDLCDVVGHIQRSGLALNNGAEQMAVTAREQETSFREIASTLNQVGAASRQICSTSKELAKAVDEVGQAAKETAALAGGGQEAIGRMESSVRQVMEASGSVVAKLDALNDKTANINSVVATITKVADQTNLLSLNAAIEAEKAGEYGLGFAVVAVEIRRLADQTAVATYDIEKMVKEMQSAVSAGVTGMARLSEELQRGVREVGGVSAHLAQIIQNVQLLIPRLQAINNNTQAQSTDAQQISQTLAQLTDAVGRSAESLRRSCDLAEQVNAATLLLKGSVSRFKLNHNPIPKASSTGNGTGI